MKYLVSLVVVLALAVPGPRTSASGQQERIEARLEKLEGSCPYGHDEVWSVPIAYGMLLWDEETEARMKNYEFVPGGCAVLPDSPTHVTLCRQCGFQKLEEGEDRWFRSSDEAKSFEIPLGEAIRLFPLIRLSKKPGYERPTFEQEVGGGAVVREKMGYGSTAGAVELTERILDFATGRLPSVLDVSDPSRSREVLRLRFGGKGIEGTVLVFSQTADSPNDPRHWVEVEWKRVMATE
ncbi:MAG: hypothetical protein KDD47_14730 [Acidobacteria bacterium]|nr:hypothetical protein [Acidobacteriota bacterium]